MYASLQILLSFAAVSVNVVALCLSRTHTGSEKDDGKGPNSNNSNAGVKGKNSLGRNLKLLYRAVVDPASKHALFQKNHPTQHKTVPTVNESMGKFEFTDFARDNVQRSKPHSSPELQRAERAKSSPIGRRDKLCFLGFSLVVVSVNVVTFFILVL